MSWSMSMTGNAPAVAAAAANWFKVVVVPKDEQQLVNDCALVVKNTLTGQSKPVKVTCSASGNLATASGVVEYQMNVSVQPISGFMS